MRRNFVEDLLATTKVRKRIGAISSSILLSATLSVVGQNGGQPPSITWGGDPAKEKSRVSSEELVILARFHAIEGKQEMMAEELRHTVARVRLEPGCISIEAYRAVRDPRLFWLHARWTNEAAFDTHAALPATNEFVERAQRLIDHRFDATRTRALH